MELFWSIVIGFLSIWLDTILASDMGYDIRGQISINNDLDWHAKTTVSANFGEYIGYIQKNGSFVIPSVVPGMSYLNLI